MAEKKRPEAWVGGMVAVALAVRNPEEFGGRLEEVNDRGIVLTLAPGRAGATEVFYPWGAVRRLRRANEEEDATSRTREGSRGRLPGDPGWFA